MIEALPGDVLLYRVTPRSSLLARAIASLQLMGGEGEGPVQYSHAALAEGAWTKVEASWPRVRRGAIDWGNPELELWRVAGPEASRGREASRAAAARVGQAYDLGELFFGLFRSRRRAICSRLVADAWMRAGVSLADDDDRLLSPNEIAASPRLSKVWPEPCR